MVTHNLDLVAPGDRVVRLVKGRVEGAEQPEVVLPLAAPGPFDLPRRKAN
jgi:hypothetical protein